MAETPDATTRPPWARVLTESVVIVGSILLAFWIDASWDARQERATERQIIADMKSDFALTMKELERTLDRTTRARDATQALLEYTGPTPPPIRAEEFDSLLPLVNAEGTFDPTNGTLASLLSSEGLQAISSHQVRALLSAWSQELDDVRRIEDAKHDDWSNRLNAYLSDEVPLRAFWIPRASSFPLDREAVLRDMRFENVLTTRLIWTTISAEAFELLQEVGEELQAALDGYEP